MEGGGIIDQNLVKTIFEMYYSLKPQCRARWRWVMPQAVYDRFEEDMKRGFPFTSFVRADGATSEPIVRNAVLCGLPVRLDVGASSLALEWRAEDDEDLTVIERP